MKLTFFQNAKGFFKDIKGFDLVSLFLSVSGLSATNIINIYYPEIEIPIIYSIVISIFILFSTLIVFGGKRGVIKQHRFKPETKEEAGFFKKWYEQPGIHRVFCSDLNWLETKLYKDVLITWRKTGKRLHLYLKDHTHDLIEDLKAHNVNFYNVPNDIKSVHRFSIVLNDGYESIILRDKRSEFTVLIHVNEYHTNPALVNMAIDMINDFKQVG